MNLIEISVDSLESAIAAEQGGAHRVELCSGLREGGLTPSLGLLRAVRSHLKIPVFVLIRPRSGDFLYSTEEVEMMRDDIATAASAGANGVVLGLLNETGDVDVERTLALVQAARPLQVTFHRAFDMARDLSEALHGVISTGCDRVLTSGGMPSALAGHGRLQELVSLAKNRITLLAGGGVRPSNVAELHELTGITEFHSSMRHAQASPMLYRNLELHLGDEASDEYVRYGVVADEVRLLVAAANPV